MNLYDVLSSYTTTAVLRITALVLAVFALRLVVLPFALVTVLLDRAQRSLSTLAATVPRQPNAGGSAGFGGER